MENYIKVKELILVSEDGTKEVTLRVNTNGELVIDSTIIAKEFIIPFNI